MSLIQITDGEQPTVQQTAHPFGQKTVVILENRMRYSLHAFQ